MPIPEDLRDAMREVHQLLQDAENDPEIAIDYDDAIQVEGLAADAIARGSGRSASATTRPTAMSAGGGT